ncbi:MULTISPECIES: hypothetical protein [unclassified Methylobacterium]|uniref:hypothetical protein n=1 Tax=unclassified Methylobacterium TaxID=2615210 RepID=UPI001650011B|nr:MULTISPECIES: hypothetical protein [unclassified Methylobacterium]
MTDRSSVLALTTPNSLKYLLSMNPIVMSSGNAVDRRWNMPDAEPVFIQVARGYEAKGG